MEFQLQKALEILERTPRVLETLLLGLSDDWVMQNEGGDTWSPYDIIGHYIEGENTDWIPRMNIILGEAAEKNFVPFDRFAQFENSRGLSLAQLLARFQELRTANLSRLRAAHIGADDLGKTGIHPQFGPVTLRQLLATWVVHDLAHVNQVSRVMAKQYAEEIGPWTAYFSVITSR